MIRSAMKDFIAKEIVPIRDELEHGDTPPYEVLRKLYSTFGIDAQAEASFQKRIEHDKAVAAGTATDEGRPSGRGGDAGSPASGLQPRADPGLPRTPEGVTREWRLSGFPDKILISNHPLFLDSSDPGELHQGGPQACPTRLTV